jgi:hypothetical protein
MKRDGGDISGLVAMGCSCGIIQARVVIVRPPTCTFPKRLRKLWKTNGMIGLRVVIGDSTRLASLRLLTGFPQVGI